MSRDTKTETADEYQVVVIGGGAAGLSAAVTLGRALRSVLVIDAGEPRNAPAAGVHGFLSRDGIDPRELLDMGREEARGYGVDFVAGVAVAARSTAGAEEGAELSFDVELADGRTVKARRILVTTGLTDVLPDIDGIRERWGRDVLHCPYCHGWEVRNKAIGILGSVPMALHQTMLFRQWSPNITLFLNDVVEPTDAEWEQLAARSISVVEGKVESLAIQDDALRGVVLASGTVIPLEAVVTATRLEARSAVLESLGVPVVEHPMGVGHHVEVNPMGGATAVPGVWAAGNVADLMGQVMASAASGVMAGAAINAHLVAEETRLAVDVARLSSLAR
ncbi:putative FAD-dependent pyridine nucleotide-disulphide oxidoreductase [Arthrobacter sp. StoSoilB3]|uniref:NAD(P)/FAD-dependent oxidoreductase n=1 Tax=Paenarthrobacter nicotinovorans TaxID=29320 RepID=UPI00166D188B|nr:NAD(P)/FAD-dependent oxidoreductase [Paenarthrobacter nicotinovorans]BCW39366.1 putative FAD-dependent pyridine nucleotide-disulphide oxidoreductase [Arthrobacter sp. StoSoilB3]MBP2393699.1 thioredoxin reductase [Paenarthrobacter nicotinovorans]UKF00055.1 NAD(P)/FAD-dependent oxidoreductase [Paenarthrobacter nicotinovorans]UKF04837.1 NAD(P)/FAD-dependent oxidoreductase [Paenarthrobacter nicotinovorans]GGV34068.1 putative FAD-dependent pyridine nucleotide-disulphide oxidoreductase [Paenarthr